MLHKNMFLLQKNYHLDFYSELLTRWQAVGMTNIQQSANEMSKYGRSPVAPKTGQGSIRPERMAISAISAWLPALSFCLTL